MCARKIPVRLKGKVYRTVVCLVLMYCTECWSKKKKHEQMISSTDMQMWRWMNGVSKKHPVGNVYVGDMSAVITLNGGKK